MKTSLRRGIFLIALFGGALAGAGTTIERLQLIERVDPVFPHSLPMIGITRGTVRCVMDVGVDGRVEDLLVIAHTHEAVARAVKDVLPLWRFRPATINGLPIGAQTTLEIDLSVTGVVTSMDVTTYVTRRLEEVLGPQFIFRVCSLRELDALPVPQHTVAPIYPAELEERGVRGVVRVEFFIDETGRVRMPVLDDYDQPELGALAIEAIRQWRFSPPRRGGRAVLVHATQEFHFSRETP